MNSQIVTSLQELSSHIYLLQDIYAEKMMSRRNYRWFQNSSRALLFSARMSMCRTSPVVRKRLESAGGFSGSAGATDILLISKYSLSSCAILVSLNDDSGGVFWLFAVVSKLDICRRNSFILFWKSNENCGPCWNCGVSKDGSTEKLVCWRPEKLVFDCGSHRFSSSLSTTSSLEL